MKVCFSVGARSSEVANKISNSVDNAEFFIYGSIPEIIKQSTMRHVFFDRVIISEKIISNPEQELTSLNNYLKEYSDNTTVVLVCQNEKSLVKDIFCREFNSPLYVPAFASPLTVPMFIEFVKGDIQSIRGKYFKEDVQEVKAVTSKYSEDNGSENVENAPVKKGLFGKAKGGFGGKKNKSPKKRNQKKDYTGENNAGNSEEVVPNDGFELPSGNFVASGGNGSESTAVSSAIKNDFDEKNNFTDSTPGSEGVDNLDGEINLDYDDLGLGDFGKQHTDTGYFDSEDEDRLDEELRQSGVILEDSTGGTVNSSSKIDEVILDDGFRGTSIIIGDRGVGVTSYIAEKSIMLSSKGLKVLIVDLDYRKNGILSFVNTDNFFNGRFMKGISELRPYSEDGIDVVSNGYGFTLEEKDILNVERISNRGYDVVIIDCPLDCINVLDINTIRRSQVSVLVSGNRGSIMSTVDGLTDSSSVSVDVIDLLYKNSKVFVKDKIDEYDEDIDFLRRNIQFSRGNWLSKF